VRLAKKAMNTFATFELNTSNAERGYHSGEKSPHHRVRQRPELHVDGGAVVPRLAHESRFGRRGAWKLEQTIAGRGPDAVDQARSEAGELMVEWLS